MKKTPKTDNWFLLDADTVRDIAIAIGETVTQSEIMLRASCARKWFYRYVLRLEKRGVVDQNLIYGSLMHALMERLYAPAEKAWLSDPAEHPIEVTRALLASVTRDLVLTPEHLTELELTRAKVQIAFDAYRWHNYRLDRRLVIDSVEEVYEIDWKGLRLVGKIDMIARPSWRDGFLVWDFKTAGRLDAMALDAWTFKFQFLFYCWLFWRVTGKKPTGLMINGLLKTALRPKLVGTKENKHRESAEEYLARVKEEMTQDRDRYFCRERIPLGTGALERFETEMLLPHVWAFRMMQECAKQPVAMIEMVSMLAMAQNTNQCHVYGSYCSYLALCKDGQAALGEFDRRENKHGELNLDSSEEASHPDHAQA